MNHRHHRHNRHRKDWKEMKNVQIPYELFEKIVLYHLTGADEYEREIREGLDRKLDAMIDRQIYSEYKTAPTEEQREKARQEYLDRRGDRRPIAGILLPGSSDRSVPRSCVWKSRKEKHHFRHPRPIVKSADFTMIDRESSANSL